ncbi:MAG TPA: sodium:proton antiporter [Thermotogota bacterium]|nr:sodium:proton antiporter [Thermotogota bacterium]HPJ87992.1 sodium:proton antiporter [Thermotogota bacterium]HPR95079.1 sodium:proton antiporter [Thermotogota bacterium]
MLLAYKIVVICFLVWVYYNLITGKMNKAASGFAAGAILISLNSIFNLIPNFDLEHLSTFVDFKTLSLLLGMMIIMPFIEKSGFFQFLAVNVVRASRGNLLLLYIITSITVAISSAFLNNVSTVMVFVPVILAIMETIDKDPFPFLMMIILSANLGGTATLIGDPPNMVIGFAAGKSFMDFLINVSPCVLITLAFVLFYTIKKEKSTFRLNEDEKEMLDKFRKTDPRTQIKDKKLMFKSLLIFLGAIVGFTLPPNLGVDPAYVSLIAGAIMLIAIKASDKDMEEVFKKMEWGTIFFFIGMFILVFALESIGVIDLIGSGLMSITKIPGINEMTVNIIFLTLMVWLPLLLTGIMSAVPMAMIMVPIVETLIQKSAEINIHISPLIWWALVFGTCFGGNMTVVGAAANIVVSGMTEKLQRGRITFSNYIRYATPIVIISGIMATGYTLLQYLVL